MTVNDFRIHCHGIEHSQYFQGAGLIGTEWRDCATGIGSSRHDAIDDAIDSITQNRWDFDADKRIVERLTAILQIHRQFWKKDLADLRAAMECACDGDGCPQCEGSELQWFVTVYVK